MNTEEQAIAIAIQIGILIDPKKGVLKITLYEPAETMTVRVKRLFTEITSEGFNGYLITLTNDLKTYSVYNIKSVE